MRNRWFHRPELHGAETGVAKRVSWLELFYDLLFVVAVSAIGDQLTTSAKLADVLRLGGAFFPLWIAWTGFTFYENRYRVSDLVHRLCVFAQMGALAVMAVSVHAWTTEKAPIFAAAAGVAQLIVAAQYARVARQVERARDYSRFWMLCFVASGALWLGSAFMPPGHLAIALRVVGVLVVLLAPLTPASRRVAEEHPLDFTHLGERYAMLTLFVLGVSVLKVLRGAGSGTTGALQGLVVLLIGASLWWIYFDDVAGSKIRAGRFKWVIWLYAHIPLQLGLLAVGVAVQSTIVTGATGALRWLLPASLSLVLASVAVIDSVTERRNAELSDRARVSVRAASSALLMLLAFASGHTSQSVFLGLIAAVTAGQVLFDMAMAPFEDEPVESRSMADMYREQLAGDGQGPQRPRDLSDAVRKGTPSELRRDVYFYFIEGGWLRLFVAFGLSFVALNVFFAALYVLEPGSISGSEGETFAEAFHFSVQTLSTIGYGAMSPATSYANTIVAVEAAVGMIFVALGTGLVFAKASRAHSSVLFSKPIVLTRMNDQPVLMFRAGNARGNEVVDASMTVSAVMEDLTPEGHHFRRLHDLKLVRSRSPMFVLSWAVMHVIDEDSPLADLDWDQPDRLVSLVATLIGHDGTYNQTIYARQIYYPEDLRRGHRFVDVISQLDDGRMLIDYSKFHDTEPDSAERDSLPPDSG